MPSQGHADPTLLTLNAGSSSIKFALFGAAEPHDRKLAGEVERIGSPSATLSAKQAGTVVATDSPLGSGDHAQVALALIRWLSTYVDPKTLKGIGHRVVHGGLKVDNHQRITPELLAVFREAQPLALAHLPRELALIDAFTRALPGVPQVACLDTAFHRDLPRMARILPIPHRYFDAGIRRLGFHGLSYTYLMQALAADAPLESKGRVVLAHLGSGASLAAVRDGRPTDTTMGFTPIPGLVMGTRPGDLDPGLLVYLMRSEGKSADEMDDFLTKECGLAGLSESASDMRDLLARRASDERAADAVGLFCYQTRKWIGACAAALEGLDTLVFSAGIGEHSGEVRAEICQGLGYLGLEIDAARNKASAAVISSDFSRVTVRVIPTDEELVMARIVTDVLTT
jgi:acetate kinase